MKASAFRKGQHLRAADGSNATAGGGYVPVHHGGWMWDLTVQQDHDSYVLPRRNDKEGASYHAGKGGVTAVLAHNCQVAYGSTDLSQAVI